MRTTRFRAFPFAGYLLVLLPWMLAAAQTKPDAANSPKPASDYSGIYSFLKDADYVQLTVKDQGNVIGLISRYAESGRDGEFINQLFKSGHLDGNQLVFTTESVGGVSFEFRGTIERGEGKSRNDEAYYVLKGTLVETTTDAAKKISSHSTAVALKSFPRDLPSRPEGPK